MDFYIVVLVDLPEQRSNTSPVYNTGHPSTALVSSNNPPGSTPFMPTLTKHISTISYNGMRHYNIMSCLLVFVPFLQWQAVAGVQHWQNNSNPTCLSSYSNINWVHLMLHILSVCDSGEPSCSRAWLPPVISPGDWEHRPPSLYRGHPQTRNVLFARAVYILYLKEQQVNESR